MAPTLQPETDEARQQFVTETSSVAGYTDSTPRAEKPDKDLPVQLSFDQTKRKLPHCSQVQKPMKCRSQSRVKLV